MYWREAVPEHEDDEMTGGHMLEVALVMGGALLGIAHIARTSETRFYRRRALERRIDADLDEIDLRIEAERSNR